MRRLFFALWPPRRWGTPLAEAAADALRIAGERAMRMDDWHVTVGFLGAVDERGLAALLERSGRIEQSAFVLPFDRIEFWHKPRALVATATAAPPPGVALVQALQLAARDTGIEADCRPWQPHLTLARGLSSRQLPRAVLAGRPLARTLELPVRHFHLAQSLEESLRTHGHRYVSLAHWPLRGASESA